MNDRPADPNDTCTTCTDKKRCKSIRWTQRPCELMTGGAQPNPSTNDPAAVRRTLPSTGPSPAGPTENRPVSMMPDDRQSQQTYNVARREWRCSKGHVRAVMSAVANAVICLECGETPTPLMVECIRQNTVMPTQHDATSSPDPLNSVRHQFFLKRLRELGFFDSDSDYNGMIGHAVARLSESYAREGHSGMSHAVTMKLWNQLHDEYANPSTDVLPNLAPVGIKTKPTPSPVQHNYPDGSWCCSRMHPNGVDRSLCKECREQRWSPIVPNAGDMTVVQARPVVSEGLVSAPVNRDGSLPNAIMDEIRRVGEAAARADDMERLKEGRGKDMQTFTSGAKSSEHLLRYDLIPWHIFGDRLARRYTEGAAKYGEFNWQKGLNEREYVLDRANHTLRHLHRAVERMRDMSLIRERNGNGHEPFVVAIDTLGDDDLAAAMWGIIFLMAAQRGSADL